MSINDKRQKVLVFIGNSISCSKNTVRYTRSRLLNDNYNAYFLLAGKICPELMNTYKYKLCPGSRFGLDLVLFPFWVVWQVLLISNKSKVDAIYTTFNPLAVILGYLFSKAGYTWIADIWDDPALFLQLGLEQKTLRSYIRHTYYSSLHFVVRRVLKYADMTIVALLPEILKNYGIDIKAENILTITNGVDLDLCRSQQSERNDNPVFTVVYVGFLRKARGLDLLLTSSAVLKERGVKFRLELIGPITREDRRSIESFVEERDLSKYISLIGPLEHNNALGHIARADVCVSLLSLKIENYQYSYPIKLLEYMAMGRAIISTDTEAVRKIVEHGRTGILIEPYNVEALTDALEQLHQDNGLRDSLGRNAIESMKDFSWETINGKVLSKLDAFLSERAGPN